MSKILNVAKLSEEFEGASQKPDLLMFVQTLDQAVQETLKMKNSHGGTLAHDNVGNAHNVRIARRMMMRILDEAGKQGFDAVTLPWNAGNDFANYMKKSIANQYDDLQKQQARYATNGTVTPPKRVSVEFTRQ